MVGSGEPGGWTIEAAISLKINNLQLSVDKRHSTVLVLARISM